MGGQSRYRSVAALVGASFRLKNLTKIFEEEPVRFPVDFWTVDLWTLCKFNVTVFEKFLKFTCERNSYSTAFFAGGTRYMYIYICIIPHSCFVKESIPKNCLRNAVHKKSWRLRAPLYSIKSLFSKYLSFLRVSVHDTRLTMARYSITRRNGEEKREKERQW